MATSAPTAASFRQEKVNYIRLSNLLIDIGRKVLKDIFDSIHKPASLHGVLWSSPVHNTLKNLKSKRVLYTQQWETLYPSSGSATSVNFDITLLFLLLRNVCGLKAPGSGWDDAPLPADISLEADLVRIKRCRNNLAHNPAQALPDSEMEKHWVEMETVLTRLGGHRYWPEIQRLKFEAVDPANENIVLLNVWEEGERSTLDAIHRLEKRFDQISLNTPPASITITGVVKHVTAAGTVLVWAGGSAYILHRYQDDPDTMIRLLHSAIFPSGLITGAVVRELLQGSFKILIEIQTLEDLEHVWKSYETGVLKNNLEDVFINQDLINSAPEDNTKIELSIVINEDEYHEASRRLMDEKMHLPEQSLPSYHPENTTISSKRASNTVVTLNDRTGKSSPIVYEAEKLSWPAIIWLFTEGKPLPVTTGKIEISINDPVTALAVALIDTNGDINVTDMSGKTPLMNAAIEGKEEVVEALLDSGADPSMVDPRGKSVVEYYAKKRKKFFGSITTTYGKKKIKKELDRLFKSLRNFAENEGDVENDGVVERLLAAGVDVNLADSNGETALIWAVRESNDKIVDDLIKTGADVNTKDKDQRSPLMIAVENNKHYITERLLDAGGDVNLVDRNGETALTLAIKKGYEKSVNALILAGADINAKDKYEQTPLISAVENNNENIAEILLDAGADPFAIANVRGRHLGF